MLASVFNKSRPINYVIIAVTLVLFYLAYLFKTYSGAETGYISLIFQKFGLLLLLVSGLFLLNFIAHKNRLSKDTTYAMLLFMVFLLLFPTVFVNTNSIIANFFLLLALRRLISLQSLLTPKEKIFDASFWIFVATLFHFWSIVYIIMVFIAIIIHVAADYRNWVIPFIAFFAVGILFAMATLIINEDFFTHVVGEMRISFDFTYFENIYQNIALAFFASVTVLFLFAYLVFINGMPINLKTGHRQILLSFLIGVGIYVLSADKNNSMLVFTFAPLAIMGANYLENQEKYWIKEAVLATTVLVALLLFILQML